MARFQLGQLLCTRGIADEMNASPAFAAFVHASVNRYLACDWGELCEDDRELNDAAVETGEDRIFAAYQYGSTLDNHLRDDRVWIITEWDRSATTILFPSEY